MERGTLYYCGRDICDLDREELMKALVVAAKRQQQAMESRIEQTAFFNDIHKIKSRLGKNKPTHWMPLPEVPKE